MDNEEKIEYHVQCFIKHKETWDSIFVYDDKEHAMLLWREYNNNHKGKYRVALVRYTEEVITE